MNFRDVVGIIDQLDRFLANPFATMIIVNTIVIVFGGSLMVVMIARERRWIV